MSAYHPLIIKPAKDDALSWREGKKNEYQQENTRPPPILGCHACSSLMSQVWWKNILSVHFFSKWILSAAWRKGFEESTTLRGLLLPISATECSPKTLCLCLQLRCIQKILFDLTWRGLWTFPFVCYRESDSRSLPYVPRKMTNSLKGANAA